MTRQWYLSSNASKGLSFLSVCADTLFAIEQSQLTPDQRYSSEKQIREGIQSGLFLLNRLKRTAESQVKRDVETDAVLFLIIDEVRKDLSLSPSQLIERISSAEKEIENLKISDETLELLDQLCHKARSFTSREVRSLATSF